MYGFSCEVKGLAGTSQSVGTAICLSKKQFDPPPLVPANGPRAASTKPVALGQVLALGEGRDPGIESRQPLLVDDAVPCKEGGKVGVQHALAPAGHLGPRFPGKEDGPEGEASFASARKVLASREVLARVDANESLAFAPRIAQAAKVQKGRPVIRIFQRAKAFAEE